MSGEGQKTLSTEETDRLNAALAMSALASGMSPVKVLPEPQLNQAVEVSYSTAASSCSAVVGLSQQNMESTSMKLTKSSQVSVSAPDTQHEPLDLSSPSVAPKISLERYDSGNESNSPDHTDQEDRIRSPLGLSTHSQRQLFNSHHQPLESAKNVRFTSVPQTQNHNNKGITRPDKLSGLQSVIQFNFSNTKNAKPSTAGSSLSGSSLSLPQTTTTTHSPVKSESELDSPLTASAGTGTSFAKWTMPYKPPHPRPLSSDCQSYSSSTSGYSSESFSEAQSEIESPGGAQQEQRPRSHLPPKKRKHIRHARNWEIDTKRKNSPLTPGTSSATGDDDVFTPAAATGTPVKHEVSPLRQASAVRPNSRAHGEKTIRINPKLVQEIKLAVTPDEEGDLPLHIAVVQENKDVIARVIPLMKVAGLSIDSPNSLRQTPLHLAVITGEAQIVSYLVKQGAAPDFSDRGGNTSLHLAVKHKQLECLKSLLQDPTKFDINGKNFEGMTPLHVAVQEKNLEISQCLLDHAADIDCQDGKSGRTALHHAVEATCCPLVAELLKRNANVNQPSYSGCSPLHVASGRGHLDIVQLLVQYGADTTMRNFTVSVDNCQAAVQNTQGASGSKTSPGGQKRNQKASVKRKLRDKLNT